MIYDIELPNRSNGARVRSTTVVGDYEVRLRRRDDGLLDALANLVAGHRLWSPDLHRSSDGLVQPIIAGWVVEPDLVRHRLNLLRLELELRTG